MAFSDGQLGKMTIIFYPDQNKPGIGIPFTPMYNPSTISVTHSVSHDCQKAPIVGDTQKRFLRSNPRTLSMELFFDGTGSSPSNLGIVPELAGLINKINLVDVQVEAFLKLGYQIVSDTHQPYYMMVIWGSFVITGVLKTASVNYTMFDADGRPLRARVTVTVEEQVPLDLINKLLKLESSDVSKSITVVEGDTLPLLCHKHYGDSALYSKIAEINKIKNYRKLTPGMQLLFPPLLNN